MPSQGDIVIVNFPFTDLSGSKPRPVIVVSNDDINSTNDAIVAAISSTIRDDEFSFPLEDSMLSTSLKKKCEVRCHRLFTCDQSQMSNPISTLNEDDIKSLTKQVRRCFTTV